MLSFKSTREGSSIVFSVSRKCLARVSRKWWLRTSSWTRPGEARRRGNGVRFWGSDNSVEEHGDEDEEGYSLQTQRIAKSRM